MDVFHREHLVQCAMGSLFHEDSPKLPMPPMLMLDSVSISIQDNQYDEAKVEGILKITDSLWFFDCHFHLDPIMPGCLMMDGLWQLGGFVLSYLGHRGAGRAIGSGPTRCVLPVTPNATEVKYVLHIKKILKSNKLSVIHFDGDVFCDDAQAFYAKDIKTCCVNESSEVK